MVKVPEHSIPLGGEALLSVVNDIYTASWNDALPQFPQVSATQRCTKGSNHHADKFPGQMSNKLQSPM